MSYRVYLLKYSDLNKSQHKYVEDQETLVKNTPLLPKIIIFSIVRLLWRLEIEISENTIVETPFHFRSKADIYRKLLPLSLVSKEIFKLVSSLFTKILLYTNTKEPNHFNTSIINPHSVMKNICHLKIEYKIFVLLIKDSAVNHTFIFRNLVSLTIKGFDNRVGIKKFKTINYYMPKLERLILISIIIDDPQILNLFKEFPSLTSLNFSSSSFKTTFSFEQLSHNITSIKFPKYYPTSTQSKATCNLKSVKISPSRFNPVILTDHLVKLELSDIRIIISTLEVIPQSLKNFLISDICKIKCLGLKFQALFKNDFIQFMKQTVAYAKSIETLEIIRDLEFQFGVVSRKGLVGSIIFTLIVPMTNIKSLNIYESSKFFSSLQKACKDKSEAQPSGFTINRSKPSNIRELRMNRKYYLKRSVNNNIQNDDNEVVNYLPMNVFNLK